MRSLPPPPESKNRGPKNPETSTQKLNEALKYPKPPPRKRTPDPKPTARDGMAMVYDSKSKAACNRAQGRGIGHMLLLLFLYGLSRFHVCVFASRLQTTWTSLSCFLCRTCSGLASGFRPERSAAWLSLRQWVPWPGAPHMVWKMEWWGGGGVTTALCCRLAS